MPRASNHAQQAAPPFCGLRVLIAEDEGILLFALHDIATDLGCVVAGSAARLSEALALIEGTAVDLAILDINLNGVDVHPAADAAARRAIPIVFATGYGEAAVPWHLREWPLVSKPYTAKDLEQGIRAALQKVKT